MDELQRRLHAAIDALEDASGGGQDARQRHADDRATVDLHHPGMAYKRDRTASSPTYELSPSSTCDSCREPLPCDTLRTLAKRYGVEVMPGDHPAG